MADFAFSRRGLPAALVRVRSDSLTRNSLFLMATAIVTALLGYVFWAVAAHLFSKQAIGIGSAVISLSSTVALVTYLGSSATLIERLPRNEHSSVWAAELFRICFFTAAATGVAAIVMVPVLMTSRHFELYFRSALPIAIVISGAVVWTVLNLLGSAFVAARRAGRLLSIQSVVSVAKVALVVPFATLGLGATGLVASWIASAAFGAVIGFLWLVPGMGLARRARNAVHRGQARRRSLERGLTARHRRPAGPTVRAARRLAGQHLTGIGGAATPLLLPSLVVIRLGATLNAYFYITWMLGGIFFMVSPAVSNAVFAEGTREGADLSALILKALKISTAMLIPAMLGMIVLGRPILQLFGPEYSRAGYWLLVLLALSAIPDAMSNIAVAALRVTFRLGYSALLNIGILMITLVAAWALMPRLGILGVGLAWLTAQTAGALASLPVFSQIAERSAM